MIDQSTNLLNFLKELTKDCEFFYIEQPKISSKEELNGSIVYSRYKRVDEKINLTLLKQHINKEITIAISVKNSNFLLFEYSGEYGIRFATLLYKFVEDEDIDFIKTVRYDANSLAILISAKQNISELADRLSDKLLDKLPKEWRVLPIEYKPNNGNLLILPRDILDLPWE